MLELTASNRLMPWRSMAPVMAAALAEYVLMVSLLKRVPNAERTASVSLIAASTATGSVASATATVRPGRVVREPGRRVTATTSWPAARAWSVRWRPVGPLAPKTAIRMASGHPFVWLPERP
jgi:hypothetical protein